MDLIKDKNVILCMNGHDHGDAFEMSNKIPFYTVKGMDGEYLSVTPEDISLSDYCWNGVSIRPKTSSYLKNYIIHFDKKRESLIS